MILFELEDEFFTQEVSLGLLKPTASVAGASGQASMLKQQQTFSHEADPNLSSKIDSLKQQNDYLFMCKSSNLNLLILLDYLIRF